MGDFDELKAAIEEEFPGWQVWRSDAGRWYATRSGDLSDAELQAGCAMTVAADDSAGLRGLLAEQARQGRGDR
ncbi:hypothetical protein [Actinomadura latina]|uniref:Uncharacterized protein n=1 Tax=Actinomadura latina TaxID=163603 RepID=A0A846Z6B0_9ACTN|nr:hypothetical protein [Actinomadura latina]NKZ05943.1 hypothetical protein [Actinomadura latina]